MDNNMVNNKQFNTAPQGGNNKVNNAFFKSKAGKWTIGIILGTAIVGGVTVLIKKIRAKKQAAPAAADEPGN